MGRINVLDCTLRDGGYVNKFKFGNNAIIDIINGLANSSIEIIECGFLKAGEYDSECTLFPNVKAIREVINNKNNNSIYVAMIQYGAISIQDIDECDGFSVDGIRLTFHEHEIDLAMMMGKQLIDKGYKVFMQPVGTTTYDDNALIMLIDKINKLRPYAFYMVDTFGKMYKKDLLQMFDLIDSNLDRDIILGFHSHNNLQMSFANAQELTQINTIRNIILDASILGMGRGAGNLNTELLAQYLNVNCESNYDILEIMRLMDEHIKPLSCLYKWGYDAAYYIAAVADCHPNYATYLLNKQTLCIRDISLILNGLDQNKRILYDLEYINSEYLRYMNELVDDTVALKIIKQMISGRDVLLMAPGKSLRVLTEEIRQYKINNTFVISINFCSSNLEVDMVFVSNIKRYKSIHNLSGNSAPLIAATSNIKHMIENNKELIINYSSYLNEEDCISDNAGLMCINMLKKIGVRKVILAGFDGYSVNIKENFCTESLYLDVEESRLLNVNIATAKKINQLKKQIDLVFLSDSIYEKNEMIGH